MKKVMVQNRRLPPPAATPTIWFGRWLIEARPVSSDCRLRAEYYLQLAGECDDPVTADAFRALAAEYMAEEAGPSASLVQQQQQIEPRRKASRPPSWRASSPLPFSCLV